MDAEQLLTLLLGGGAVATIGAFFKGVRSIQADGRTREKGTIKELVEQRKTAWTEREKAIKERDYWRNWAGTVEYAARSAGVELPAKPDEPHPSTGDDDE